MFIIINGYTGQEAGIQSPSYSFLNVSFNFEQVRHQSEVRNQYQKEGNIIVSTFSSVQVCVMLFHHKDDGREENSSEGSLHFTRSTPTDDDPGCAHQLISSAGLQDSVANVSGWFVQ